MSDNKELTLQVSRKCQCECGCKGKSTTIITDLRDHKAYAYCDRCFATFCKEVSNGLAEIEDERQERYLQNAG